MGACMSASALFARREHPAMHSDFTCQHINGEEGLAIRICRRRLSIFGHVRRVGDYRKRHQPTPHYAWPWTLAQALNRTSGRSGSASEDDPAECGCSRSRTTLGSTTTTPGGSHMTASLEGATTRGRSSVPLTDWLTDWFCWRRCIFGGSVFFCWRRSLGLFLEEVDFVGGGVFFGGSVFLLEEVMCVFGAGWH